MFLTKPNIILCAVIFLPNMIHTWKFYDAWVASVPVWTPKEQLLGSKVRAKCQAPRGINKHPTANELLITTSELSCTTGECAQLGESVFMIDSITRFVQVSLIYNKSVFYNQNLFFLN